MALKDEVIENSQNRIGELEKENQRLERENEKLRDALVTAQNYHCKMGETLDQALSPPPAEPTPGCESKKEPAVPSGPPENL